VSTRSSIDTQSAEPPLVHEEAHAGGHFGGAEGPGDLPAALPTKVGFVINMSAARRIGVTFPELILRQAREVIS
jgi:hypothetical protein